MSPAACGKAKELNQCIFLDKGLPSVETMRDKLASCRKAAWVDYRAASDATISTLKEMALSGELSREELAFINHELGKELAVRGYRDGGKIGISENSSWTNNGQEPLTGFFDTELRQKELVNSGMTVADAAQFVELGKIWVGDGAKQTSQGGWISADGTRGYRPPSAKDSPFATTGAQANFETYKFDSKGNRILVGNGHLNISGDIK